MTKHAFTTSREGNVTRKPPRSRGLARQLLVLAVMCSCTNIPFSAQGPTNGGEGRGGRASATDASAQSADVGLSDDTGDHIDVANDHPDPADGSAAMTGQGADTASGQGTTREPGGGGAPGSTDRVAQDAAGTASSQAPPDASAMPGSRSDQGGKSGTTIESDAGTLGALTFGNGLTIALPTAGDIPFPVKSEAVPPANPSTGALALSPSLVAGTSRNGCGESPSCIIRTSITTVAGRSYGAMYSTSYPSDSCGRDIVDDKASVLIGDSLRSGLPGHLCTTETPQITVGALIPTLVASTLRTQNGVWSSNDGFRSQWRLANGLSVDNGDYVPSPGGLSQIEVWWFVPLSGGEAYGQLQVPLRHTITGASAVGYMLFDVRVR